MSAWFAADVVLLVLLVALTIGLLYLRQLFAAVMVAGMYSLVLATLFVVLDAVDVAFTEAAVGAGVSTVLMLAALALTKSQEKPIAKPGSYRRLGALLVVSTLGGLLLYASFDFPYFAQPDTPVQTHVTPAYLTESQAATTAPNVVTSVLSSYRGYDTLGETVVVFTAGVAVLLLIGGGGRYRFQHSSKPPAVDLKHQLILRVTTKLLVPVILLFALYVQFHGDFGPGGGFQAGVIFASGFILYALVFGLDKAREVVFQDHRLVRALMALGVLIYAGVGVVTLVLGGNFLDYNVLASDPTAGQHMGILLIEFGVGLTVAAVMVVVFFAFAGRGRRRAKRV